MHVMDFIGEQSENYRSFASVPALGPSSLSFISKYKQGQKAKTVFSLSCHYMYYERTSEKPRIVGPILNTFYLTKAGNCRK